MIFVLLFNDITPITDFKLKPKAKRQDVNNIAKFEVVYLSANDFARPITKVLETCGNYELHKNQIRRLFLEAL